tara:strand:- start:2997 stop:4322 length:1326 start_codon:yes stop_codon:yes gene_type:complete
MYKFDSQVFYKRRQEFLSKLNGKAAIIPGANLVQHHADCEYPFRQNSNFWYLTGFDEPDSIALFLSHKNEGEKFILFVHPKDQISEVWQGFRWGLDGAKEVFKADRSHSINELENLLPDYLKGADELVYQVGKNKRIESLVLDLWSKQIEGLSRNGYAPNALRSPDIFLNEMRLIKSEYEIERMREAAKISADAHEFVRNNAFSKKNERQLQGLIEGFFLDKGTRGPAYNSIVASGDNACVLHYTSNNCELKKGDLVLIDAGCSLADYYNGDITRTFPFGGKFSGEQKAIYEIVLEAQKSAIRNVITGVDSNHIHKSALKVLIDGLKELNLLKGDTEGIIENGSYRHLYMHRTGHWLGLDVHDVGAYRLGDYEVLLQNGMILTVEPGIYISDRIPVSEGQPEINERWKGIGIRIEDDVLVNNKKAEVLTKSALKEISELES